MSEKSLHADFSKYALTRLKVRNEIFFNMNLSFQKII